MIRYAEKNETEYIKKLFNICFPGEANFCYWFFKNCFKAENTLIDAEKGVLRGSAMELPYKIKGIGEITYLYAVGTLPEFRGRGISSSIIRQSHENDRLRGRAASVLIPGNKSLFDFYSRLGYRESSFITEKSFTASDEKDGLILGKCKPADLLKIYDESLSAGKYVKRSKKYFEKQLCMFKSFGGGCLGLFDKDLLLSYCFYSFENGKILFDEIMGDKKEKLAGKILNKFNFSEGTGREPGKGKPLGMAYFYNEPSCFYMNLMYN